ncbi:sugar ABC transporter permease [Streptomyces sp. NPDC051322]|uniref:carbohydrate ABC transporter permease n=1 Tax=Streptomyces sp. NPDC051322 TaxID=3154645 RepID=UPI00344FE9F0
MTIMATKPARHRADAAPGRSPGAGRWAGRRAQDTLTAYRFLSLPLLLFLVFLALPLVCTVILSFFQWDTFSSPKFIGLDNYRAMLHDPNVGQAFLNTMVFTVATTVLHLVLALVLALAVNRAVSPVLRYFLRTAYFFPLLVSAGAGALVWMYMVDPSFGFVDHYLGRLGADHPPNWLLDSSTALWVMVAFDLWHTIGFTFVIVLAGLQSIPPTLYEAARVDGAGTWRQFRSVTVPMLSPSLLFASITAFTGAFQIFDPMYIMTQGGPGNRTLSVVEEIYNSAFRDFKIGYGSSIAVAVAVVIVLLSLLQLFLSRYWVNYDRV